MKKRRILSLFIALMVLLSSMTTFPVKADVSGTLMTVSRTADKTNVDVGETVNINYNITPKSILNTGNDNGKGKLKDIVLVFDTSESMNDKLSGSNNSRLSVAKTVAKNFIDKFSKLNNDKARIEIIEYNRYAVLKTKNFINSNSNNKAKLIAAIDALRTDNFTNTGDGLRLAYSELQNAIGQDKYLILLTDGIANTFGVSKGGSFYRDSSMQKYFNENNYYMGLGFNAMYGSYGDTSPFGMNYAKRVASELIANNKVKINTFVIDFGNTTGSEKNKEIANAAKGTYYSADENTVINIYNNIQAIIENNLTATVDVEETIPEGLKIVNQEELLSKGLKVEANKVKGTFNAYYKLSTDGKSYQLVAPIQFDVKVQAEKSGTYIIAPGSANIAIENLINTKNTEQLYFNPPITLIVGDAGSPVIDVNADYMNLNRTVDKDYIKIGDKISATYNIQPKSVPAYFNFNGNKQEKDIVLIMDVSGSMDDYIVSTSEKGVYCKPKGAYWGYWQKKIDVIKGLTNNFIDNFSKVNNVNISIIAFSNKANFIAKNVSSKDTVTLKNQVKNLAANGGTNTGDSLRKAYYDLLEKNKLSPENNFIVLMTDGEPTSYSYYGYNNFYFGNDLGESYYTGGGSDEYNGGIYANYVARNYIGKTKFKSFVVGFYDKNESSSNKTIAANTNGKYYDANDEETLSKVLSTVQGSIEANLQGKLTINETIPNGFAITNVSTLEALGLTVNGNVISGDISVDYTLDAAKENFIANPINFIVNLQAIKEGTHILGGDTTSKVILNTKISNAEIKDTQSFKPLTITVKPLALVRLELSNATGIVDTYDTRDGGDTYINKNQYNEIFTQNLKVDRNSTVSVVVDGYNINYFKYQIISTPTMPSLTSTGWTSLSTDGATFNGTANFTLPNKPGTYYIAYQTGNTTGSYSTADRYGLYGPFERGVDPAVNLTFSRQLENDHITIGDTAKIIYTVKPVPFAPNELYKNITTSYPPYEFDVSNVKYHDYLGAGLKLISNDTNITANGQDIVVNLNNINKITYTYNEETKLYEADAITFEVLVQPTVSATSSYRITKEGFTPELTFTEATQTGDVARKYPVNDSLTLIVTNTPNISITATRSFDTTTTAFKAGDNININYTIHPSDIDKDTIAKMLGSTPSTYEIDLSNFKYKDFLSEGLIPINKDGLVASGQNIEYTLPTSQNKIIYTLQADGKTYKAKDILFSIEVKTAANTVPTDFNMLGIDSIASMIFDGKEAKANFNDLSFSVVKKALLDIKVQREIVNSNQDNAFNAGTTVRVKYTILPQPIKSSDIYGSLTNIRSSYSIEVGDFIYRDLIAQGLTPVMNSNMTLNGYNIAYRYEVGNITLELGNDGYYRYNSVDKPLEFYIDYTTSYIGKATKYTLNGNISFENTNGANTAVSFNPLVFSVYNTNDKSSLIRQGLYVKKGTKFQIVESNVVNITNNFTTTIAAVIDINDYRSRVSIALPTTDREKSTITTSVKLYRMNSDNTIVSAGEDLFKTCMVKTGSKIDLLTNIPPDYIGKYLVVYTIKPMMPGMKKNEVVPTKIITNLDGSDHALTINIKYVPKVK